MGGKKQEEEGSEISQKAKTSFHFSFFFSATKLINFQYGADWVKKSSRTFIQLILKTHRALFLPKCFQLVTNKRSFTAKKVIDASASFTFY